MRLIKAKTGKSGALRWRVLSGMLIFMEMNNLQKTHFSALILNMLAGLWIVVSPWLINFLGLNATFGVMVAGIVVVITSVWILFKAGIFKIKRDRVPAKAS
ncbi:MAG: SPW repeat protein [Patescibacteria group bacterium]|nr:SPW repeat protein [Patescibacteria group bacterium]